MAKYSVLESGLLEPMFNYRIIFRAILQGLRSHALSMLALIWHCAFLFAIRRLHACTESTAIFPRLPLLAHSESTTTKPKSLQSSTSTCTVTVENAARYSQGELKHVQVEI